MRTVDNLGDVQIVLNQLQTQVDALIKQGANFKQATVTGIPDPKNSLDAVNLRFLKQYIQSQIGGLNQSKATPNSIDNLVINVSLNPKKDNAIPFGRSALRWAFGYFVALFCTNLTSSGTVTISSGGLTISAGGFTVIGNSAITGTLGVTSALNALSLVITNAITAASVTATGSINANTLVASGTVTGSNIPASIAAKSAVGTYTTGAKLTVGGVSGLITVNADGSLTFTQAT